MDKADINRLRRKAQRLGMRVEKSPRRDPAAIDFDTFALYGSSNTPVLSDPNCFGFGFTLAQIEDYLNSDPLVVDGNATGQVDVPAGFAALRFSHRETRGRLTAAVWELVTAEGERFELVQWSDVARVEVDARAILLRLRELGPRQGVVDWNGEDARGRAASSSGSVTGSVS